MHICTVYDHFAERCFLFSFLGHIGTILLEKTSNLKGCFCLPLKICGTFRGSSSHCSPLEIDFHERIGTTLPLLLFGAGEVTHHFYKKPVRSYKSSL